MNKSPSISIVMPVHNCESYIRDSIDSIFAQTFPDFELIIVNDGSSDNSGEIAHSYLDKRLKIIDLPKNTGCFPARNTGMRSVKGKYICVMDADDISLADRLEKQYNFMEGNTEFGLTGGVFKTMDDLKFVFRDPDYETIKLLLLQDSYLSHPTCMIRALVLRKHNLYYDESYKYASDYDWQVRASSLFPVSITNAPVLLYRIHDQQISTGKHLEQTFFADQIRVKQLAFFGIEPTETEKSLHLAFIKGVADDCFDEKMIDRWIIKLTEANRKNCYYKQQKLQNCLHAHRYLYFNKK